MPGFLYYKPNVSRVHVADVKTWGLGYAFSDRVTPAPVMTGPDSGNGCVFVDIRHVPAGVGYYPEQQVWRRIPGGDLWVGYYAEQKPTPADLIRDVRTQGYFVKLGDGNDWLVPLARSVADVDGELGYICRLPKRLDIDEEGKWTLEAVMAESAGLWEIACEYFEARWNAKIDVEHRQQVLSIENAAEKAVRVLSANYVVSDAECAALGLLTDRNVQLVLDACCDIKNAFDLIKKKMGCDGESLSAGFEDAVPDTGQP